MSYIDGSLSPVTAANKEACRTMATKSAALLKKFGATHPVENWGDEVCDGAHQQIGFDGTETASREPYNVQAKHIEGPTLVLDDAKMLCAFARFCDTKGSVWNLVLKSDQQDVAGVVEQQAGDCPGGRLRARQRATGHGGYPGSSCQAAGVSRPTAWAWSKRIRL